MMSTINFRWSRILNSKCHIWLRIQAGIFQAPSRMQVHDPNFAEEFLTCSVLAQLEYDEAVVESKKKSYRFSGKHIKHQYFFN